MAPTKVLCLHGAGTSAKIWETQLTSLRYNLPEHWEWTFVDGEEICDAAEGITAVYDGPFHTYYTLPTAEVVADCHLMLDETIQDAGPFDIVIGFSQGGALAASYILHRQLEYPHGKSAFSLAVFFCASLPYSKDNVCGVDMTSLYATFGSNPTVWKSIVPSDDGKLLSSFIEANKSSNVPQQIRRWHPTIDKVRVGIPTVHIFGSHDPYLPQGQLLQELCEPSLVYTYKHAGGHEVPRAPRVCKEIAQTIIKARARSDIGIGY